tara:strand:- start:21328 stop:22194 length:867 start_codon:yes stop_codon:yes gene_type:complete
MADHKFTAHSSATDKLTWLVTGCSKGLGRAIAEEILDRGDNLIATARDPSSVRDIAQSSPGRVITAALDVTHPEQIDMAVSAGLREFHSIDIVVNNAGFGIMGTIEEVSDVDARRLFDTNFFGTLSVLRATLPVMRPRGKGHIVNIASIGGLRGQAGSGIYAASKFAMVGMSEALAAELSPFGVGVTVVAPGGIQTDFFGDSLGIVLPGSDYSGTSVGERLLSARNRQRLKPGNPKKMASAIVEAVTSDEPPLWLVLGNRAYMEAEDRMCRFNEELVAWSELSHAVDD